MESLINAIQSGQSQITVSGLTGSLKSYVLAKLKEKISRPILLITPTARMASEISEDLRFFGQDRHLTYPSLDALPYYRLSPHLDASFSKIETLYRMLTGPEPFLAVAPLKSLLMRLPPRGEFIGRHVEYLHTGEEADWHSLVSFFEDTGYQRTDLVEDKGTFSLRGNIIDFFAPLYENPIRVEFEDNRVTSIRFFRIESQRSFEFLKDVTLLPAREIFYHNDHWERAKGIAQIPLETDLEEWREEVKAHIEGRIYFGGIETFIGWFYSKLETLFDYIPKETIIAIDDVGATLKETETFLAEVFETARKSRSPEALIPPEEFFLDYEGLKAKIRSFSTINLKRFAIKELEQTTDKGPSTIINIASSNNYELKCQMQEIHTKEDFLLPLERHVRRLHKEGYRVLFACHSMYQAERLSFVLKNRNFLTQIFENFDSALVSKPTTLAIVVGGLSEGFQTEIAGRRLCIVAEAEVFGERALISRPVRPPELKTFISDIEELRVGDYVVHQVHGIGVYKGVIALKLGDPTVEVEECDYIHIEYLGDDKLFVPVYKLNQIQRYIGPERALPSLDRLGGITWEKKKTKISQSIRKVAAELVKTAASRKLLKGYAFSAPDEFLRQFEGTFEFEETADQERAIDEVLKDMQVEQPMDRVICGDVGYGKTEVALRAAFKATMDGKQVAVLVPTTILAHQHYQNFRDRLSRYPVRIEMLSRFRTIKEQKLTLKDLASSLVDIVIGTHRLLSGDVKFRDLGLLVIDEEQRFGVLHKEKIKKLKSNVDVLTLTATPIPRTMQMALGGIKELSIINTPPASRLPIRTYFLKFNEEVIRDAIYREIKRGGQVYFVHNRVESIGRMYEYLTTIVPDVRISVAHGQMKERGLEQVMVDFIERKFEVLLCTAIIESGLDIANVNTIFINHPQNFGLAQLYQLRGRVGRSAHRAYAYLLTPQALPITRDAERRLKAIADHTELGSGFKIAMRDLEIRGGGHLLGTRQTGRIAIVGYETYNQMVERAVRQLKGEEVEEEVETEVNLPIRALIPLDYIQDPNQRLSIYRRISSIKEEVEASELISEIKDRYGQIPQQTINLFEVVNLRNLAGSACIKNLTFAGGELVFTFEPTSSKRWENILNKILKMVGSSPDRYRLTPNNKLYVRDKREIEKDSDGDEKNLIIFTKDFLYSIVQS